MDIDWCAVHRAEAIAAHMETAEIVASSGAWPLLVSSDAVFSGDEPFYAEHDRPRPAGAYGEAKLAAESRLSPETSAIVRLSYVYGLLRHPPDETPRFDVSC